MAAITKRSDIKVPTERSQFLFKLLTNPNYFGNIADSSIHPVQVIKSNTTYEELKCVGFSPELSQLEGVVWIKQSGGYDGGICTSGSQEYVSFFLSYDNGVTWLPQGTVNFTVYDVPDPHPLEYAVRLPIQPEEKFCFVANLPLVRAILSWNMPPTGPNSIPVWGNVIDTRNSNSWILFEVPLPVLLEAANVTLPAEVASVVGSGASIKLEAPKALSAAELHDQYAKTDVPPHRFLQSQITSAMKYPAESHRRQQVSFGSRRRHRRRHRRACGDQRQYKLRAARVHRARRGRWRAGRVGRDVADQTADRLSGRSLLWGKPRIRGVLD